MGYNQDNPFSRKSSPLNSFDSLVTKLEGQGKSHEAATKIAGSVANAKMHGAGSGPTAAQKARHGVSRQPGKPVEENRMTKGDQMPSRKSSSPLNHPTKGGDGRHIPHSKMGKKFEEQHKNTFPKKHGIDPSTTTKASNFATSKYVTRNERLELRDPNERSGGPSRRSSSPLNNTGVTGLNYSNELQYMPIEDDMNRGMSRESSSPLDYGSWANEDATRAKKLYAKGDDAHARALGVDEHDADYGKWRSSEAEHGPSRKSRSERLRNRAMKRSERSGAEWGDYDYEDKRVQKMLSKASELDERSGQPKVKPMEMKMMMTF